MGVNTIPKVASRNNNYLGRASELFFFFYGTVNITDNFLKYKSNFFLLIAIANFLYAQLVHFCRENISSDYLTYTVNRLHGVESLRS
jgi:hypothetical protein